MSMYAINWMKFFDLPPTLKSVLRAICDEHRDTTGDCHPSHRLLQEITGFCRSTIKSAIRKLEALGLLKRSIRVCKRTGETTGIHFSLSFDRGHKVDPGGSRRNQRGGSRRDPGGSGDSPSYNTVSGQSLATVDSAVIRPASEGESTPTKKADETVEQTIDTRPLSVHDDVRPEAKEARNRQTAEWYSERSGEAAEPVYEFIATQLDERGQRDAYFTENAVRKAKSQEEADAILKKAERHNAMMVRLAVVKQQQEADAHRKAWKNHCFEQFNHLGEDQFAEWVNSLGHDKLWLLPDWAAKYGERA